VLLAAMFDRQDADPGIALATEVGPSVKSLLKKSEDLPLLRRAAEYPIINIVRPSLLFQQTR
jgi:hypothetical protein